MSKPGSWKTTLFLAVFCAASAVSSPAQSFTTLVSFNGTDGSFPLGSLVQGFDGNLYGTTTRGGTNNNPFLCYDPSPTIDSCGTVFKVTSGGTLTTLYNFCAETNCADGDLPSAGLVQGTDGNLYGTTSRGGANDISACPSGLYIAGCGTVFRITPGGTLTTLHSFDFADGFYPMGALVQATDGNFYGTTEKGGAYCTGGCGTVFKITPAGTLTTLHTFDGNDGIGPVGTLVQGTDGNLYGTTVYGGASSECLALSGCGTAFEITPEGTLTTIYNFCSQVNCTDGMNPYAGLVQGTDGNFYGTTSQGGSTAPSECSSGCGTVFKITPGGELTTLNSFDYADGLDPMGALVQATDGNFYGTTDNGGTNYYGTILQITPEGTLTTLYNFQYGYGTNPQAALIQATNGTLYGTTSQTYMSGAFWGGTVFSLSMGLGPFVETLPTSGTVGTTVIILGNNFTGATSVSFNGIDAAFTVVSSTEIAATVPLGATTGTVQVTTPTGRFDSNLAFAVLDTALGQTTDFYGDGKSDVAIWRPGTGYWYVLSDGDGPNIAEQLGAPGDVPVSADYDGDGIDDVAVWRPDNSTWYIIPGSNPNSPMITTTFGSPDDVPVPADYDGNGIADIAVWRPSNGTWYILPSGGGPSYSQVWGESGDIPVPGDYFGKGNADYAVWRPSNATWYVLDSSSGQSSTTQWGEPGDIPVPGDYFGDGHTDYAVWRPSKGTWYVMDSSTGQTITVPWGETGDVPVVGDYNGDGKNDYAVFRPSNGTWYIEYSSGGGETVQWGETGDIPATRLPSMFRRDKHIANFDGDLKTDIGVFRPSNGTWYAIYSSTGKQVSQPWGESGDIIVPGDYDGDGKTDYAIWRPSTGTWWVTYSSTGKIVQQVLGQSGDIPVPGDYDGDGKTDYAVFRPSTGTWYVIYSSTGEQVSQAWGESTDIPVPADYDGDGKTDYAVFRPSTGTWYVILSSTGAQVSQVWGVNGDIPVPGDYDGDGKADYTVFRPSNGTWYTLQSSNGQIVSTPFGENGDIPVAREYDGDFKADIAVFRPSNGTWYILQSSNGQTISTPWGLSTDVPVNQPTGQ